MARTKTLTIKNLQPQEMECDVRGPMLRKADWIRIVSDKTLTLNFEKWPFSGGNQTKLVVYANEPLAILVKSRLKKGEYKYCVAEGVNQSCHIVDRPSPKIIIKP